MLWVEGNADLTLVRTLLRLPRNEVLLSHGGRDLILKDLARQSNWMALLDEDPANPLPVYLTRMTLAADFPMLGLRVLEHRAQNNRVILLRPRLEEWLLRAAGDAGLDVGGRRYNLPSSPTQLHREINLDLRKVERLVADLTEADSPRIRQLRALLTGS